MGTVFRFAYMPMGTGRLELEGQCDGVCPFPVTTRDARATESHALGFGLELLAAPAEILRLGTAFHYVSSFTISADTDLEPSDDEARNVGSDLSWTFDLELQIPADDDLAVALRGRMGPWFVFPGGALKRDSHAFDHLCDDSSVATECDPSSLTRVGWTYGASVGPVFSVGELVRLRADLVYQHYAAKLFSFEGEGPGWEGEQGYWFVGHRLWLSLAVELWG